MPDKKWIRRDNWIGSEIEDSFVLLSVEGGDYISFNTSAKIIWELLEHPISQNEVVSKLMEKYEVSLEQCQTSVQRTFSKLVEHDLIQST